MPNAVRNLGSSQSFQMTRMRATGSESDSVWDSTQELPALRSGQ